MHRNTLLRLSLSAAAFLVVLASGASAPDASANGNCYCTIPNTLQISGAGSDCSAAQSNFNGQASFWADQFCDSLSAPSSVCDGLDIDSQSACFWDFDTQKWRINGFVSGHCLFCPGSKGPPPGP